MASEVLMELILSASVCVCVTGLIKQRQHVVHVHSSWFQERLENVTCFPYV